MKRVTSLAGSAGDGDSNAGLWRQAASAAATKSIATSTSRIAALCSASISASKQVATTAIFFYRGERNGGAKRSVTGYYLTAFLLPWRRNDARMPQLRRGMALFILQQTVVYCNEIRHRARPSTK